MVKLLLFSSFMRLILFCYLLAASFSKTGVVPCASVKTYSPVIMTKAKAKSSISNCAEEELPPCSTLHPSLEDVEKNYEPLLAPDALSSTTTAKLHTEETTLNHAQMYVVLYLLNELTDVFSAHLI